MTTADNPGSPISAKTYVNGETTTEARYYYAGNQLSKMTRGDKTLVFTYDSLGPRSVVYNGSNYYYYLRNAQGDILGIVSAYGAVVASYTYDVWGNVLSVTGSMSASLGTLNPLRYRGYVYDTETKLYYLNSRYYNPATGRFINADIFVSTGQGVLGNNMFAYCNNNPVNMVDDGGNWPKWVSGILDVVSGITQVIAGSALVVVASPTVAGSVAGGFMFVNGMATVASGIAEFSNDVFGTNFHEENVIRTTSRYIGKAVGGQAGEQIASTIYDCADFAATVYSIGGGGKTVLTKTAKALGKEVNLVKSNFSMLKKSIFMDSYFLEQIGIPLKAHIFLPKPWFRAASITGGVIDTIRTAYKYVQQALS